MSSHLYVVGGSLVGWFVISVFSGLLSGMDYQSDGPASRYVFGLVCLVLGLLAILAGLGLDRA